MEILDIINNSFYLQLFIILFLGLFVGSFLNVVNYRLPLMNDYENALMIKENVKDVGQEIEEILIKNKNINLSFPPSSCPNCNHKIRFYENIPILSWLFLNGKCSSCKSKISFEYPLVEFLHSASWVFSFFVIGFDLSLLFILPMISIIFVISCIDFKHKVILNGHAEILGLLGLSYSIFGFSNIEPTESIISGTVMFVSIYSIVVLYEKIRKVNYQMMGRGDFYIYGSCATWLGYNSFYLIMYSSIVGLLFFSIKKFLEITSKIDKDNEMPFAPSILIAFLLLFFNLIPI